MSAKPVLQHGLPPQHVGPVAEYYVIAALVVVEQNTGQRRLAFTQAAHEHLQRGHPACRRNQRQLALAALFTYTDINMPHRAALCTVIIRRHVKLLHPGAYNRGNAVGCFRLDQAALDRHDLVAARPIKAGDDAALLIPPDRILRLVPVMHGSGRAGNAKQPAAVLPADTGQRVAHLFLLRAQLLLVGDVLVTAAPAPSRRWAGRFYARAGRHDQLLHTAKRDIFRHLDKPHVALVAHGGARDKHRASPDFGEPHAIRSIIADLAAINFIFDKLHSSRRSFSGLYPYYIMLPAHTAIERSGTNGTKRKEKARLRGYPLFFPQ